MCETPMRSEGIFKKILVPTDGSPPSVISQQLGALIAEKFHSEITVLHAVSHGLERPRLPLSREPLWTISPTGGQVLVRFFTTHCLYTRFRYYL